MTDSQRAAQEILELFTNFDTGVVYINPRLFEGKDASDIEAIKAQIRGVIDHHMC